MTAAALAETPSPEAATGEAAAAFRVEIPQAPLDIARFTREVASRYGKTPGQQMREFVRLAYGFGRLQATEYYAMRLFDDAALAGADKRDFLGIIRSKRLVQHLNRNSGWRGAIDDKVAFITLMGGLGFPVGRLKAIFGQGDGRSAKMAQLKSEAALRAFLLDPANYPMFGKPIWSSLSLGSESLAAVDSKTATLTTSSGRTLPLDGFLRTVTEHYSRGGYLLQDRIVPHPAIRAICGDRLPTIRVVTISSGNPDILGVAWKIPAGENVADNFWRPGNLLATLDPATGRVSRVVRGSGLDQQTVVEHPDSGAPLIGFQLPHWEEVVRIVKDGAAIFGNMAIIGWDVAVGPAGPVLVEGNTAPDLRLLQIADRRGAYGERFRGFVAACEADLAAHKRSLVQRRAEVLGKGIGLALQRKVVEL